MTTLEVPEPNPNWLVGYTCPEPVGYFAGRVDRTCNEHFIFRSSYERHWLAEHGGVPYEPDIVGGGVYPSKDHPPIALPVVDGLPGPGAQIAPLSADPRTPFIHPAAEHVVPWTEVDRKEAAARLDQYLERTEQALDRIETMQGQTVLGQWVDEAQDFPAVHHVIQVYGPVRVTQLDAEGQPTGETFLIEPLGKDTTDGSQS